MNIPHTITEEQLWTAIKPFYDLLGVTPFHLYDGEAPTITRDDLGVLHVRFPHVMEPGVEMDWPTGQTGDGEVDEKTYEVDIVVEPDQSLRQIWPGVQPAATPTESEGR